MIKKISYNWYASTENGEEFTSRVVGVPYGKNVCEKIVEHLPIHEGDKIYYDIHYSDGSISRVFNPNEVFFEDPLIKS